MAFLVVAALSCFATAKSFMLLIDLPWYVIVPMVVVFFATSSFAFKLIMDAVRNNGSEKYPKAKFWGGIALLLLTWVLISLPTNAHTFFFIKQIGAVVTNDLSTTISYAEQLAKRQNIYPEEKYNALCENCQAEFKKFSAEVKGNNGKSGFGDRADSHISKINEFLGKEGANYSIKTEQNTNKSGDGTNTDLINKKRAELAFVLNSIESKKYRVEQSIANTIRDSLYRAYELSKGIDDLIQTGSLWSHDDYIKQINGYLSKDLYPYIRNNSGYVKFNSEADRELYTAETPETQISRFLDPYKVMGDFFTGRQPFRFIFLILLSILLDVIGFISFDLAFKN